MTSSLEKTVGDFRELVVPPYEYKPLDDEAQEQRFLVLHPCQGDKSSEANHVRCSIEVEPLPTAQPFIAVKDSRGYRLLHGAIEIDGQGLIVPVAVERFLRYYRRDTEPVRLWIRHVCLLEFSKHEQQKYWTRPFINSMYERATEVVNMNEFNQDMMKKGVFERVLDIRYQPWTKMWSGRPDVLALPRVFPIKLGKILSNEKPVDHYEYVPLDMVTDEIRIMVVMEAPEEDAPLVVHIGQCPIHCEVTYLCLSYMWGDREPTAEITLNGQRMRVRKNVEMALRKLRGSDTKLCIWIDAVCIDQLNLDERNRQLTRMSEIYDQAIGVLCYVGDSDEHSDEALDFVPAVQGPAMRFDDKGDWDITRDGVKIGRDQYPRLCASLYRFLTRPYFKRVWVLQEVAVASNPMIACGGRFDTSLERLENSAFHLQDMIHSDPRLAGQMKSVDDTLLDVREEELSYIRKLSYFRHLESRGDSAWTMMGISVAKIGDNAPGILETAILTRDFQATDGHDKIFALWNLAKDKDGLDFKMDYSEPIPTSFTKFAAAWVRQHGRLDIIAASEPVPESRDFYANAPSWCPDWTVPAKTSCLLRRDTIPKRMMRIMDDLDGAVYSADGGMTLDKASNEPFFTFEGDALYCTGIILDNIATFLGDLPAFPKDMRFPMGDPQTYFRYVTWMEKLDNFYKDSNVAIYEDPMQAAKAMFHGDLPSAWPRREENPGNCSETYPQEKYVCKPELSRYVKFFAGSYSRLEARDHVKMVLRGRTLCVTEKGYMALAPSYVKNNVAEKPWVLAILATCSVPVLMQENDDGSYKICGTCFVQGWMEGEVLKDEMGVDSPADFWSAMEGSSKLKIV